MPRSPAHPPVPTGCSRPSRQLLLAGDSTRDYESGGLEFESLRARTFGTVVLAERGRYCAQPCHTLIASLSNTAMPGRRSYISFVQGAKSGIVILADSTKCPTGRLQGRSRVSKRGNNIVPAHEIPPQTSHALPRLARLG